MKIKLSSKSTLFRSHRAGFTLIELLVVISIIALLSSVILAALNGARDKGRVASAIEFADYNYHKLGVNTLLSMNFDECPASNLNCTMQPVDSTGNYSISPSGTTIPHSSNTPFGSGSSFDNSSGSYQFNMTPVAGTINIPSSSGMTTSVWYNITNPIMSSILLFATVNMNFDGSGVGLGQMVTQYNQNNVQCSLNGITVTYNISSGDNKWHNITCALDQASNSLGMYFDGKLIGSPVHTSFTFSLVSASNPIGIGHSPFFGLNSNALIDNVQIFTDSLTASAAKEIYAEGLAEHQFATR